jgi:hypothetical protein
MRIRRTIVFTVMNLIILLLLVLGVADMTEDDRSFINIAVTSIMLMILLALVGAFVIWATKLILRGIDESKDKLLKKYDFVYYCSIDNELMNECFIASNDTSLKLVSGDGGDKVLAEFKKEFIDITIEKLPLGLLGKTKGIRITSKPGGPYEYGTVDLILLDATKILNPPLRNKATNEAIENLCRFRRTQRI